MDYFKSKLPQYKYETYDTASASGDEIAKPPEAGGSVAALLVDGDLNWGHWYCYLCRWGKDCCLWSSILKTWLLKLLHA